MKWGLRLERIKGSWCIRRRDKGQITQSLFNKASRNHTILYISTTTHNIYSCHYRHERKLLAIWLVRVVQAIPKTIEIINVAPIAWRHCTRRTQDSDDLNWTWSESLFPAVQLPWFRRELCKIPREGSSSTGLCSGNIYEPESPVWQEMPNGARGTHISVATHSCLIGLKIHSTFWHFKSYPCTHS